MGKFLYCLLVAGVIGSLTAPAGVALDGTFPPSAHLPGASHQVLEMADPRFQEEALSAAVLFMIQAFDRRFSAWSRSEAYRRWLDWTHLKLDKSLLYRKTFEVKNSPADWPFMGPGISSIVANDLRGYLATSPFLQFGIYMDGARVFDDDPSKTCHTIWAGGFPLIHFIRFTIESIALRYRDDPGLRSGRMVIALRTLPDDGVEIEIQGNGRGIPPAAVENVFRKAAEVPTFGGRSMVPHGSEPRMLWLALQALEEGVEFEVETREDPNGRSWKLLLNRSMVNGGNVSPLVSEGNGILDAGTAIRIRLHRPPAWTRPPLMIKPSGPSGAAVQVNPDFRDPSISEAQVLEFRAAVERALSDDLTLAAFFESPAHLNRYLGSEALRDYLLAAAHRKYERSPYDASDYLAAYIGWVLKFEQGRMSLHEAAQPIGHGLGSRMFYRQWMKQAEGQDWSLHQNRQPKIAFDREASAADRREAAMPSGSELLLDSDAYQSGVLTTGRPDEIILVGTWRGRRYVLYASHSHSTPGLTRTWRAATGGLGGDFIEKQPVEGVDDLSPEMSLALDQQVKRALRIRPVQDLYWNSGLLGVRHDQAGLPGLPSRSTPLPERGDPSILFDRSFPVGSAANTTEGSREIAERIGLNLVNDVRRDGLPHELVRIGIISHFDPETGGLIQAYEDVHFADIPLIEILDNAVQGIGRAMEADSAHQGMIRVVIRSLSGGRIEMIVSDNGGGISRQTLQGLFIKLGDAITTKRKREFKYGGAGQAMIQVIGPVVGRYGATVDIETRTRGEWPGGHLRLDPGMLSFGPSGDLSNSPVAEPLQKFDAGTSLRIIVPTHNGAKNVQDSYPDIRRLYYAQEWTTLGAIGCDGYVTRAEQAVTALAAALSARTDVYSPFERYWILSSLAQIARRKPRLIAVPVLRATTEFLLRESEDYFRHGAINSMRSLLECVGDLIRDLSLVPAGNLLTSLKYLHEAFSKVRSRLERAA